MLTIPTTTKDLGTIAYNNPVTVSFDLINNTNEDISVINFGAACGCSTPSLSRNPILANSTAQFNIVYNAAARGDNRKSAYIIVDNEETKFYFSANVQ